MRDGKVRQVRFCPTEGHLPQHRLAGATVAVWIRERDQRVMAKVCQKFPEVRTAGQGDRSRHWPPVSSAC